MIKYVVENFKTGYRVEYDDVRHAEREYRHFLTMAGVEEGQSKDIVMYHYITQDFPGNRGIGE